MRAVGKRTRGRGEGSKKRGNWDGEIRGFEKSHAHFQTFGRIIY
jgi:hypothetical protein